MTTSKKPRKAGSGRKQGAVSCVRIPLSELNRIFKPDALITVGRKWAEQNKLQGEPFKATNSVVPIKPIEVTEIDLDDASSSTI